MSDDPRDAYLDDVVALLVTSEAGADTLRAAAAGEDIRTPAFRSEAGPVVLLFADPDEDVREDMPGVSVLHEWDDLPAVVEWLAGSEGAPLAQVPRAFLVEAGEAVEMDVSLPLADSPEDAPDEVPTEPPASLHSRGERSARQEAAADTPVTEPSAPARPDDRSGQGEEPEAAAPVAAAAPIDLPTEPTAGPDIAWRLQAGRLTVTRAPIDPAAVPTERQAEAAAMLLRLRQRDDPVDLNVWRDACRAAWRLSAGAGLTAFKRTAAVLCERGAIEIEGGQVHVVDGHLEPCRDPLATVSRSAEGATEPCRGPLGRLSRRLMVLIGR